MIVNVTFKNIIYLAVITMERVEECVLEMATTITIIIQVEEVVEVVVVEAMPVEEEVEEITITTTTIITITTEENVVDTSISKKLFQVH